MTDSLISSSGSRIVSIAPSNATEFSQGQKIIFDLDASLGYIKGRDTYLVLDVLNDSSDASMWSFPQGVGAHALINRIDIYSRSTGQHLETLENYNQWACIETQFTHDDFTNIQQLEGVGSPCYQYTNGYFEDGTEFREQIQLDPRKVENCMLSPLNADNKTPLYATRRFLIQPKCGVFRHWDTEQITPCVNMGGLRIEIIMEQNDLVCKRLGAVAQQPADDDRPHPLDLLNDGIAIVSNVAGGAGTISTDVGETDGYFTDLASLGLCKGNKVKMVGTLGTNTIEFATTIADLTVAGTAGQINIAINPAFPAGQDLQDIKLKVVDTSTSYKVKAAEMRVAVMMVPPAVIPSLKGALMYEFTSYDHFIDTIAATERRHQVPINSVASKARAVFSHFTDVNTETNMSLMSYYSGMAPSDMDLNSVQYFINNRLYPLRAYNPDATQDKPIAVNEVVKAMKVCGMAPINLGSNEGGNLNDYTNSFVIARELARGEYVADLRNAEPEIRLGFSATRAGNIRVNTYVFSRKVVNIGVSGVAVEL